MSVPAATPFEGLVERKKGSRLEHGRGRLGRGEKDHSVFREAVLREEVRGVDRKEERTFLSLFLHARPPTPTHRCQTALAKKLVCKHTPTSGKLPSSTPSPRSPFRGWELALRRFPGVAGVGGGRKVGMGTRRGAHACQEPARSQVFSSCNGGRVSTLRTPQAPREGREVPKTAGLRTPRALPNSGTLPSPLPLRSPGEAGAPPSGWVGAESPSARVWVRAGGGGLGRRSPPRRNPAYF